MGPSRRPRAPSCGARTEEDRVLMERFRLDGRVAIVTGAGRGIGRAIAIGLAEAGARVVCAARTVAQIEETAEAARAHGNEALALRCDVNDAEASQALVDATREAFGRIDILVNNAGGHPPCPVLKLSDRSFEDAFRFNVGQAMRLSRMAIPSLLESDGASIVNISSAMSHLVDSGFVAYGTAKAALNHMTRLMACEFAPRIRVNALAVGAVETDALGLLFRSGNLREQMVAETPMGRLGQPEDIAIAALYLASPASSWVTGKVFEVDGGTVDTNWPLRIPAF
ncbi:MAG: glucose 1-dehydrogenase [Deltaproteobacteria bacterium]|nr:glucose 1-dehydrogenase [Deltaproteobacteria bacterium]MCB9787055.1 glucose 1-dehydrogenase [Deltaproteobacteria bacterium]